MVDCSNEKARALWGGERGGQEAPAGASAAGAPSRIPPAAPSPPQELQAKEQVAQLKVEVSSLSKLLEQASAAGGCASSGAPSAAADCRAPPFVPTSWAAPHAHTHTHTLCRAPRWGWRRRATWRR